MGVDTIASDEAVRELKRAIEGYDVRLRLFPIAGDTRRLDRFHRELLDARATAVARLAQLTGEERR
jgi:hypothetical protein